MTHKEYLVIIDYASTNMSEIPNLPPTFRETAKMSKISDDEKVSLEAAGEAEDDKSTINSRNFDSDTDAFENASQCGHSAGCIGFQRWCRVRDAFGSFGGNISEIVLL